MILQFPVQERRRASKEERLPLARQKLRSAPAQDALAACRAEFQAIARSATVLATGLGENQGCALMRWRVPPYGLPLVIADEVLRFVSPEKEKPRQGGTWGPGLEPRMGRAEARTIAAKAAAYTANSLCL
jgi:hypothetical protein